MLLPRRRRLAGAERGSCISQIHLQLRYQRICAAQNAPRGPFRLFDRRHGLAEIIERGVVQAERHRVSPLHLERDFITISENASRHGHRFAQQCLGFFELL